MVVHLSISTSKDTPGLELVGISRAKGTNCLAIGNTSSEMSITALMKIVGTLAYERRKNFIKDIKARHISSRHYYCNKITQLNPNDGVTTIDGIYAFLLYWYISL